MNYWCFACSYLFVSVRLASSGSQKCVQILWKIGSLLGPQLQVSNNLSSADFLYSKHDPKRCEKNQKNKETLPALPCFQFINIYPSREREPGPENELKTAQTRSVSDKEMRPSWEGTLALVKIKERDVKDVKDTKGKLTSSFFWSYE